MSDMTDFFSKLGNKQRDKMVRRFFTDQHGRRFFAWADKLNQRPIGEFVLDDLTGQFVTPPFIPAMQYAQWPQKDGLEFVWAYEKMADEYAGYTANYYDEAAKLARHIRVDVPKPGDAVVPEILSIMGPPPLSPEVPLACQAGERWILGYKGAPENTPLATILHQGRTLTSGHALDYIRQKVAAMIAEQRGVVTESTVPVAGLTAATIPGVELTYREFVAAEMKSGKTMGEAATAWKAHKANLEGVAA